MFLMGKKVGPVSIHHPMRAVELTEEELQQHTQKLKSGDHSVVETLTKHFIKLAVQIAGKYAHVNKSKNDLLSEAILGILSALHDAAAGHLVDDNLTPFVSSRINASIVAFIRRDRVFGVSHSTVWLREQQGQEVPVMRQQPLTPHVGRIRKREPILDLRDMIDACVKNELEKQIVDLRIREYVDQEIAELLQLSTTKVHGIRDRVRERFEEKEGEL